jgi:hypothetical protein
VLPRQFPCYDRQRLRNLLTALALATPEQRSRAIEELEFRLEIGTKTALSGGARGRDAEPNEQRFDRSRQIRARTTHA